MRRSRKEWARLGILLVVFTFVGVTSTGCAELAATLINDARSLHTAAEQYVSDVHERRREVRRLCWEMLTKEVEALEQSGEFDQAREKLKANYPSLVTTDIVKSALNKDAPLDEPFGCE